MDYLDLKDSARANQLDCIISYFFQLHLILHACVQTFDVTGTREKKLRTKQGHSTTQILTMHAHSRPYEHTYTNPTPMSIFED